MRHVIQGRYIPVEKFVLQCCDRETCQYVCRQVQISYGIQDMVTRYMTARTYPSLGVYQTQQLFLQVDTAFLSDA